MTKLTPEERFWGNVDKSGECWLWTRFLNSHGYGQLNSQNRRWLAHRFSYTLHAGPIPEGVQLDHLCHVRSCVNPSHLRLVTNKQNNENHRTPHKDSKSGALGVTWIESTNRYRVTVGHNGKQHHGGYFDDLESAANAAKELRNSLFTHNILDREEAAA